MHVSFPNSPVAISALVDTGAVFTGICRGIYESHASMSTLLPHSSVGISSLQGIPGRPFMFMV